MASKERENLMDDFKQQLWELKVVISEVLNGSIGENQWLEPWWSLMVTLVENQWKPFLLECECTFLMDD